jgi:hypothetical protein
MRIIISLAREETKEALKSYSLHYASRLLRFVGKSLPLVAVALLLGVGIVLRRDTHSGLGWQSFSWLAMVVIVVSAGVRAKLLPARRFPHGTERVLLFDDEGLSVQNLFGRVIHRERWSRFAPAIETSNLYLLVSPRSPHLGFRGSVGRTVYVIPKRLLSANAHEFRQLIQDNLRRYPEQITQIAS